MGNSFRPFLDLCRSGEEKIERIDDWVDRWRHEETGKSLPDFLGMSEKQYAEWVKDPGVLRSFVVCEEVDRWNCFVTEVGHETFFSRWTNETEPETEVEMPVVEVSEADRELLQPGAYYTTIAEINDFGQVRLRYEFSREKWTQEEIDRAKSWAAKNIEAGVFGDGD